MGVELRLLMLPRPRSTRVDREALAALVRKLTAARFLPADARVDDEELGILDEIGLRFSVESFDPELLRYPLLPAPAPGDSASYDVVIRCAPGRFMDAPGDCIDPVATRCACGEELDVEGLIEGTCPSCGARFRPEDRLVQVRDPETGTPRDVEGGACASFMVVIECGKCWVPGMVPNPAFTMMLMGHLGCAIETIPDIS